jgi:NTP pyrophosphatase (non-canonical NTP hydrolase)
MEQPEMTLEIAQKEVGEWALRNFGEQSSYRPVLGMMEELGEFCEARDRFDVKNMRDAIGDIGIYMLHYCAIRGWSMSELWDDRVGPTGPIMSTVKALCHSQLKGEQNIRGGAARHDFLLKKELSNLLWRMDQAAIDVGTDCLVLIYNVWEKVKQRDWQKNPNNADKVVEESRCADTLRPSDDAMCLKALDDAVLAIPGPEAHRNTVPNG